MLYKFVILSDEVDDFLREITVDSEATFYDLHDALLDSVKFNKDQMTSFFICSEDWEKEQEVTLFEMDSGSEVDNLVMSETELSELISDEDQKLLYIFDYLSDRAFFIELKEIIPGKTVESAVCSISNGLPPEQFETVEEEVVSKKLAGDAENVDASFYGEGFEMEELDEERYSDLNMGEENSSPEEPAL